MTDGVVLAKRGYVAMARLIRGAVRLFGVTARPAAFRKNRYRHWLQSLLAIYDIEELIRLDVPWWTYDAIEQVEDFLGSRSKPRVFEYGSGASTVWLAKRAHSVVSIDHDAGWIENSKPWLATLGNATVEHVPADTVPDCDPQFISQKAGHRGMSFRGYVDAIDRWPGKFDLIVVDGRARSACLNKAVDRLSEDGLIVFDNSHRARYRQAIESCVLETTDLRGLVPSLPFRDQTTLLRHRRRSEP